jgi:PAS domain S-box-containing protein
MTDGSRTKLGAALDEERVRILEELHRSQERYRVFFDTAFAGIGITDADEKLNLANTALEEILGFDPGELVGVSLSTVTTDEEFYRYRAFT